MPKGNWIIYRYKSGVATVNMPNVTYTDKNNYLLCFKTFALIKYTYSRNIYSLLEICCF